MYDSKMVKLIWWFLAYEDKNSQSRLKKQNLRRHYLCITVLLQKENYLWTFYISFETQKQFRKNWCSV